MAADASTSHPGLAAIILMYHRVAELSPDVHRLCIAPTLFREQMETLKTDCRPVGLTDLVDSLASDNVPRGAVAITFDDGSLDNLTIASPILQEFDLPATFFITTERLIERHEFWWDELERILIASAMLPDQLDMRSNGGQIYPTGTPESRLKTFQVLASQIRVLPPAERDRVISRITAWAGAASLPRDT